MALPPFLKAFLPEFSGFNVDTNLPNIDSILQKRVKQSSFYRAICFKFIR